MMTYGKLLPLIAVLSVTGFAQTTYKAGRYSGTSAYTQQVGEVVAGGENAYCPAGGSGEFTESTPTWGATDGPAQLPQRCMNTATGSTPSGTHIGGEPATIYTPEDTAALNTALASLQCGDTIVLAAGNTYTGSFTFPSLVCDGSHWITVKSSGANDPNFPSEGVRATPCIAGMANDAIHERALPGYPDYVCASYPAVLAARIVTASANQPAVEFASGANHYRFIGIEFTKAQETKVGAGVVELAADGGTLGANHIIFDRCLIHGQPWTLSSSTDAETQGGVRAKNSQWVAVVNSWIYDTYCNSGCVDSQAYSAGTGLHQDGPHKLYNNLLASSGEPWIFGGGGQGPGTPNTRDLEARGNHLFKPLGWMVPIETCSLYNAVTPKNLGEFKNMTFALIEGNVAENSWQGCQSDQAGYAWLINPSNQNNHQSMTVNFDGTNIVVAAGAHSFSHHGGNPADAANCPPGGCVLEIADATRADNDVDYVFCNGANGCDQTGMDLVTQARLTSAVAAGTGVAVNACVPGDCPTCKAENLTYRYNEIFNTTNGFQINSGLSSHCHDEAAGMSRVSIHDNLLHGLSREMGNGSDPYQMSVCAAITSNTKRSINSIELAHNTCAIETGNTSGFGGLGHQNDHTNKEFFEGFDIHDNVSPAPWLIARSSGTVVTKGIGGNSGLANTYAVNSCDRYYANEAPDGTVVAGSTTSFTFSPAMSSYMVTIEGQYAELAASPAPTPTSFTLEDPADPGDALAMRDLTECPWAFRGNLLGTGLPGSGRSYDPYPASNTSNCGTGGNASCVLDGSAFTSLFADWGTGRAGNFSLTSAAYLNSATDGAARTLTGKNPGADMTALNLLTAGVRGSTFNPTLTVNTNALPGAMVGTAYQASMLASAGASPFKRWWVETNPAQCGGNCGTFPASAGVIVGRGGTVNGPFIVGTAERAAGISTFSLQQTTAAGAPLVGQTIVLSGFANGAGSQSNDGSFNGTCVISTVLGNSFSCLQSGVEISSHAPNDASVVTFAPTAAGSYSFWMGARDGAFQEARGAVTLTIATEQAHSVDLMWNASASNGQNGCCRYRVYRSTSSGSYGPEFLGEVSGLAFTDPGVLAGATYYYVVTAFNGDLESGYSNEATAVVP